ncbi:MAG TPA: ABC transporter permease subunit [Candidatus Limnocylindria bacterium]|nr:ABC transporter permease subunit [Candidatus Limnocylindria bacterium]
MTADSYYSQSSRRVGWVDFAIAGLLAGLIYALVTVAHEWGSPLQQAPVIHLEASYLPGYALLSLSRGVMAYGISFLFTLLYGYAMARVAGAERVLLPALDILQSVPVLGFLPGFVLGLVHLFPHRNIGLEMASVLMIFTGQVWNMTFSFYASLKSVPPDLVAVARLARMSWWTRFFRLDLSFAATGLLWNSMMSMAGGWFFLMVSEAFVLGDRDFRLPGLGSYMSLAIERGDAKAQWMGVLTMLGMITLVDQLVWRPLVAWSHKFSDEPSTGVTHSWLWEWIRSSRIWQATAKIVLSVLARLRPSAANKKASVHSPTEEVRSIPRWRKPLVITLVGTGITLGVVKYISLLATLSVHDWLNLLGSTGMTFSRVLAAVALASLWTIPVGVMIGRHPVWSRIMQPVIQMAASFPAPMIFPVVVGGLLAVGTGLGTSSIVLLLLGTQWYILFNVIAGCAAIPHELWEVSRLSRFSWRHRWVRLILPAIFPSVLTGWITATGGAWNASIVAEYMKYRGNTLSTMGLGAVISQATERGDFHLLAAAVGMMAFTVVVFNRLVWRPLSRLAQTRFSLET